MKKFFKVLITALLIFIAPVAMMGWLMADGVKWWVAGLAGLGVLVIIAFLVTFFTTIVAQIKGIRAAKKIEKENAKEKV